MSPAAKDVPPTAPFRAQTLQWFEAGDTFSGTRHQTEYLPERFRWLLAAPFLWGLGVTLAAGLLYWFLRFS